MNQRVKFKIKRIAHKIAQGDAKDIRSALQRRAVESTAEYIENKLPFVQSVTSKEALYDLAIDTVSLKGLFLEFGVWSGRSLNYLANKRGDVSWYGFDSFEGLPEDWYASFPKGTFSMEKMPDVVQNVQLIKGWFNKTLPEFKEKHDENVAFIHVDCDLYSSAKCIFDILGDRIKPETVILFDEYFNYPSWKQGEYLAFQEFCRDKSLCYSYISYNELNEQVLIKIEGSL